MSVLLYAENWEGRFKKQICELASYGAKVAEMTGGSLYGVTLGNVEKPELESLGKYGVEKVVTVNNPALQKLDSKAYTNAICQVAKHVGARVIIFASTNAGKSIAPRLSVRMNASMASNVVQLPSSIQPFLVSKKVYSGGAFAKISLDSEAIVLTLSQNSFDILEKPVNCSIEPFDIDIDPSSITTKVKEVQKYEGKVLLTDAEIVVAGGRGMKSPDNWQPLVDLADLLGGATACSRPVSDEGWRPHAEHTGQTGKIIAPNLYIAVGISGATQHLAGVSSSKCIVAINTDKSAPIFEAARYGIVGDAAKVLPKLVEKVKELNA